MDIPSFLKHQVEKYPFSMLLYIVKWMLLTLFIGIVSGSASAIFLLSLDWITHYRETHPLLMLFLPLGGLGIGLVYHYWGKSVSGGNNVIIDTIQTSGPVIPFIMAPFVYFSTLLTHLLGGSAGREGTALQMAGALADQFSNLFKLNKDDRAIYLTAAIAAGFGGVFGTPLAGALFSLEICIAGKIKYAALFQVVAASILADLVTKYWQVHHTPYSIGVVPPITYLGFLYAIIAGAAFGLCSAVFTSALQKVSGWLGTYVRFAPFRPFIGGIIVLGLIGLFGTSFIGLGIPSIVAAFLAPLPPTHFLLKILFTVVTLGTGFKGGEVTPLFFIGAALGNALSFVLPLPTGLLAGMGFVGVFAGATNAPLASIVLAMELFGSSCGVYVAIACVVAYLCSGHSSIYHHQKIGIAKHHLLQQDAGRLMRED